MAPVLPSEAALAAFGLTIDQVRFIVVRHAADTLADTTVALLPDVAELALDLRVPLVANPETLGVSVIALSGTIPMFTGSQLVQVPTVFPPPEIPLTTYIGPIADSIVILPRSPFILLGDSLRFQVLGFNGGASVTQFFVAWSTSDSGLASINHAGALRAPAGRSSVWVRARTPSGAEDSVIARFTPAATQLALVAGNGQSQVVGTLLPVALDVQARAADGLGVGGVVIRFRALSGGGAVTDTLVVTDSLGHARTSAILGGFFATQTFEASVAGLSGSPVVFNAVALAGPPSQIVALAGDGQLAPVATLLPTSPSVRVRDAGGNPVAGVGVTFAVASGGGTVTGATQLTNASGVASLGSWRLGTAGGTNTLTATLGGVTPLVFTATGLAGAAISIVKVAADSQSAIVNTLVPAAPQVKIVDQFGNPVAGVVVSASVTSGGGSVTAASPVTDAAGVASVGGWRLGATAGQNSVALGATGLGSPITFTATGLADAASQLAAYAGDGQAALIGSAVSINPAARVTDQFGNAIGGVPVTFAIGVGGGTLLTPTTVTADTAGIARASSWTLGTAPGPNTLVATAPGLPTATFSATGVASTASTIALQGGDGQVGSVATALTTTYSVIVHDAVGLPVAGVPVSWAVASGAGSISPASSTTDAAGIATSVRTLGTSSGTQTATASVGGLSGSPVVFTATALPSAATRLVKKSLDPQSGTVGQAIGAAPSVRVEDQYGNGVPGITVTFAVTTGGGLVAAATPTSDAQGIATVGGWTLGTVAGTNNNALSVAATGLATVTFSASAVADAPTQLAFVTQPSHTLAGDLIRPPVGVAFADQFANVVPGVGDIVSVQLSATPNPAAKLLGITSVPAIDGIATFDVGIDSAGSGYTLAATTPKIGTSVQSASFDIGGVVAGLLVDRLGPVAAALNPSTNRLYVAGAAAGAVAVLDADKLQLVTQIQGFESPFDVAVNSETNTIYVSTLTGVVVIDGARNTIVTTIPVFGAKGIAVDEKLNRLYVAVTTEIQGPSALASIDGSKNTVDITIPLLPTGSGVGVVYDPNDRLVYVAMPGLGVAIVDPADAKYLGQIDLAGAKGTYGLGLDGRSRVLYATNQDENSVSVIDVVGRKEITRLAVGRTPQSVGVDSVRGMVYIANSGESTVSFIEATKFNVVGTLMVGPAPKAAVVQAATGRVFVPTNADDRVRLVQP